MKHIFILNPIAGRADAEERFLPLILKAAKERKVDYSIHRTINKGDGCRYVKEYCLKNPGTNVRFYAVGGDGTLNEVVNGAYGFDGAEAAFIPAGTGNDFARAFTNYRYFKDIKRQIDGKAMLIDLIKYNDRYCINVLNIGLDCQVVAEVLRLKKNPLLKGALAYGAGVVAAFIKNEGYKLNVSLEDGRSYDEQMTLVAVGNGSYYGGGFKGLPMAKPDDGLLDVSIIFKVRRLTFARLIGKYRKGTHLNLQKNFICYSRGTTLTVESKEGMKICVDGEIDEAQHVKVTLEPACMAFCVPAGCELAN
jgi:diacylglycerol kinase (ATP)